MTDTKPKYSNLDDENGSEDSRDLDRPLPFWRKLCFAVGGAPHQMTTVVIDLFFTIFLLEVALVKPWYVTIIVLVGRGWGAFITPVIGVLAQKTDTRFGKMRPWIILSAPLAGASYFFLFSIPFDVVKDENGVESIDASDEEKLVFYLSVYCILLLFLDCVHIPYSSLTMYVTTRPDDRDHMTGMRMSIQAASTLTAIFATGVFVSSGSCEGDESTNSTTNVSEEQEGYQYGSIIVTSIFVLCCVICFLGTEEKKGIIEEKADDESFCQVLFKILTFRSFVWFCLTNASYSAAVLIVQGNCALFATHGLKVGHLFTYLMMSSVVTLIAFSIIWQRIMARFGKKFVAAAGMIMLMPAYTALYFLPADNNIVWLYYCVMIYLGVGVAVATLLPWSMLPDVIDVYTMQNNSRQDALFYSIYMLVQTGAVAIVLGLAQGALGIGGYVSGLCHQPESVEDVLRIIVGPVPCVLLIIALICLYKYPIDEETRKDTKEKLLYTRDNKKGKDNSGQDISMSYESIKP